MDEGNRSLADQNTEQTENLALPYIMPSQAQKHVTHNEAIRMLDAVVQLSVLSETQTAPPASPDAGARYIIGPDPTGDWSGKHNQIAAYQDSAWMYYVPQAGWLAYVASAGTLLAFDGAQWSPVAGSVSDQAPFFGINTNADATNRLAAKSDAVLFSHDDVTPGSGDVRFTINKAANDKTSSLLFQSNWSGHAEFGLSGDNDIALKVSDDGANWQTALQIDAASATTRFGGPIRLGGDSAAHDLHDYCEGEWTPALGTIATHDYAGATGLTVHYGRFTKTGRLVTIMAAFKIDGVTNTTLTRKSSLMITGLPYPADDLHSGIDQGGSVGFLYGTFGGANNTPLIGGFSSAGRLYLCAMASGADDARADDTHFITASYLTT